MENRFPVASLVTSRSRGVMIDNERSKVSRGAEPKRALSKEEVEIKSVDFKTAKRQILTTLNAGANIFKLN